MEHYLEFAKDLAKEAEAIALKYFNSGVESTWKEDNSPLTKADTEINDLVIKRVNESFPEHSIYGEEQSELKEDSQYIWVCDPIDGTIAFSCGLPEFVFSLALVDQSDGQVLLGLINDPSMGKMYWAEKDGGAYCNNKKIEVNKLKSFETTTYSVVAGTGKDVGFRSVSFFEIMSEKKSKVMKFPSFVYGAIQIASGKFTIGAFYNKPGHDVAALKIIIEEAGGKVTDLNGNERRYDQNGMGCLISNSLLHDELVQIVQAGKIQ